MSDDEQIIAGRYRLVEKLGTGGMGVVWQAYDERLRRKVAVKQVLVPAELTESQGEELVRRTMREGRIAARLQHPQLITVFDVVQDGGRPYLIMEYLPSTNLSALGVLSPAEVARIGAEAAAALAAAHEAGVVHRDVKPANVLVGEDDTVKITDFGIARVAENIAGTLTSTFSGTPAYLAPEVAKGGAATYASDVYSLGATLYTAVEGTPPSGLDSNPMAQLYRIASGAITPPTKAGPLTDVLLWLLTPEPEQRPTMAQARDALAGITDEDPAAAPVVPAPAAPAAPAAAVPPDDTPTAAYRPAQAAAAPPPERSGKRGRVILFAAGLLVVAVAAALVTMLVNRDDTPSDTAAGPTDTAVTSSNNAPPPPGQSSSSREETTTTTTTTKAPTTTTTTTTAKPPPPAGNPAAAVSAYYAMMPGGRAQAWERLTPNYQQSRARGRESYENFWRGISAVSASEVSASGSTVEATVIYTFTDGRRVRERHRYTLVNQNGTWLIDTSSVLSSNPA